MTAAFQNFSGSGDSGFTSDAEGANARLDVTMSEDSARNLWDVQAAIQQIATDFQTAVRAAADFNNYLISIRETSQTVRMPELGMEGGTGGNMDYAGGRVDRSTTPLVQSEIGMAQRIGEMEENQSGAGGGAMAARAQREPDVGGFVNSVTNAAWMASMTGQHGGTPQATSDAYQTAYDFAQRNPRDPLVYNATYNGQTGTPHAFAASQVVSQGLPAAQRFLGGGGIGGFAAMAGRLGTWGAIGYAGYQVVNAGLETYAQSRAMALQANDSGLGAGWGFGQRVGQATMAMSPFVSGEEAASIYNTAVTQGWASGDFAQGDFRQALNFMYTAAKDYQMSPEMSAQLLQNNSLSAGQSVQALSEQLLTLKNTLDGTGVSLDVANAGFANMTGFLIASGANPAVAAQVAGGSLFAYAGNTALGPSGRGSEIILQTMQTQQTQNILAGLTGTLPGAVFAGANASVSAEELQRLTSRFANQVLNMSHLSPEEQAAMFQQLYNNTFGTQISPLEASNMIAENAANPQLLTDAQREYRDRGRIGPLEHQNAIQSWWHGLDSWGGAAAAITGNRRSSEEIDEDASLINSFNYYNPQVNALLSASGDQLGDVVLYGPDGQPVMVDGRAVAGVGVARWFNSVENYNKFAAQDSGYYIQDPSGNRYNSQNIGLGGSAASVVAESNEANTVYITLSPAAKQWFDTNKDRLELSDGKN